MHKRALGAVAVTGVAALALGACGGSSPTTPSNTGAAGTSAAGTSAAATTTGEPETPTGTAAPVRDTNVDLVIWTDADRSKAVQKYADEFAAENGVTVKVQIATDTRTQFKDATKVGKGPDVIVGAHDWLGELVQNSTVAPINLSADVSAKFLPKAIEATKFNGQSYGVPYAVENIGLMYNKDLVPTPPKTMDELVTMGEKLVKEGKAKGVLSQFVSKVGNAYFAYPYLSAFPEGGIFATKPNGDYDPNKVIVNTPDSVKGGEVLAELGKKKVLSTNVDDTNQDALFDTKKVPFMISGPWSVAKAKEAGHQLRHRAPARARRWRHQCVRSSASRCSTSRARPRTPRSRRSSSRTTSRARTSSWPSSRSASARRPSPRPTPPWRPPTPTSRRGTRRASTVHRCPTSPP